MSASRSSSQPPTVIDSHTDSLTANHRLSKLPTLTCNFPQSVQPTSHAAAWHSWCRQGCVAAIACPCAAHARSSSTPRATAQPGRLAAGARAAAWAAAALARLHVRRHVPLAFSRPAESERNHAEAYETAQLVYSGGSNKIGWVSNDWTDACYSGTQSEPFMLSLQLESVINAFLRTSMWAVNARNLAVAIAAVLAPLNRP